MGTSIFRRGINNYRTIQNRVFSALGADGSQGTNTLSSYPTTPGCYRIGRVTGFSGLPTGINGYGTLLVANCGTYAMHIYIDNNKRLYWSSNTVSTVSVIEPPAKWYYAVGTEVNAAS